MLKKITALLLCITLLVAMVPVNALIAVAAETADTTSQTSENDKNGDGYDDNNVYLSDIMLAIASDGGGSAKEALITRGFTVFPDLDMYHTANNKLYMYFGYKTTKDPNKAIKDIKWMNYSEDAYANGETALTISYGAQGAYVATKVNYLKTDNMNECGQIGLITKDSNGATLPYYLEEEFGSYEGAATMKLVMDILLVGLIYDPIIHALMDAEIYSCMYYATNNNFGDPILVDSLLFTNNEYEDGYENVSGFMSDGPQDLRWGVTRAGIDRNDYAKLYMHFKRAHKLNDTEPELGNEEYLYDFTTVLIDTGLYDCFADVRKLENQGWHDAGTMYRVTPNIRCLDVRLLYRTTNDPNKAIHDMRVTDNGHEVRNIAGTTYFKALSGYKHNALYISKSRTAGEPILASTFRIHCNSKPELPDGHIYANEIFSKDISGLNDGNENCYFSYGGTYKDAPKGKYIMSVMVGYGGSKTAALADLANQGAETYIDRDILDGGNYEYIGYNTTDDESLAMTNMTISSLSTTKYTYHYDGVEESWEQRHYTGYTYFPDVSPDGRIESNGSVYTLVSRGTNIDSPVHERDAKNLKKLPNGSSDLTIEDWGSIYYHKYDYDYTRDFLYQTDDYMAGDPITSISLSETAVANDGSVCVFGMDGNARCYNGCYIMMDTDDTTDEDESFLSEIYTVANGDRNKAIEQLAKNGCGYFVDYNMNEGVGGEQIYIGYQKTTAENRAIRDMIISRGDLGAETTYNGMKYMRAAGSQLNHTVNGDAVYIYTTTDTNAGEPLVSLYAEDIETCRFPAYQMIRYATDDGASGAIADMNAGIDTGAHIYLFARRVGEKAGKYISNLSVVEGNDVIDALNKFKGKDIDGYIRWDLNKNAGGQYIYLGYKTTDNPDDALTNIVGYHYESHSNTETFNQCSYTICDEVDLNMRAGGDFIFLYQSKDKSLGAPITSVSISGSVLGNNGTYTMLRSEGDWVSELNCGAGGDDIYLHFTREAPEFQPYIERVELRSDGSWGGTLARLAVLGCTYYVDYDLNRDAGGYFICMGYTRTDDPNQALRGLETIHACNHDWQYTRGDGAEFSLIDELDLNRDAGGDFIFMYKSTVRRRENPLSASIFIIRSTT